jgi:hypothetical protein
VAGVAIGSIGDCSGCVTSGGALAGVSLNIAFQQALEASRAAEAEAIIHKAALEEAGQSLAAEVRPIIVEVQGETIKLTGSVEAKFEQWRKIMTKLYQHEIGPIQEASPSPNSEVKPSS